ncbi:MAG: hypothetical protein Q4P20_10185 [Eubacteriales bacterium]|nr:hypothetical protein [Eubacteriales bacterium]
MPNNSYHKFLDHMFTDDLLDSILEAHLNILRKEDDDIIEQDFCNCMEPLSRGLTESQKEILSRMEQLFRENMHYAMRFGFSRGISAGFDDFTPFMESFDTLVQNQLLTLPNMKQYPEYHRRSHAILEDCTAMESQLDGDLREHFISFECGWENRVYGVTYLSYIFGFLYAQDLRAEIRKYVQP